MAHRDRPNLSITLPRNFHFHFVERPRTPEQEHPAPAPPSPHAYRIRRRIRPRIATGSNYEQIDLIHAAHNIPLPTIELPALFEPSQPSTYIQHAHPTHGYLAPLPERSLTGPRPKTPSAQRTSFNGDWDAHFHKAAGDSIRRPASTSSFASNSSDDSTTSSHDQHSLGGSCTSPESESGDPFYFPSSLKGKIPMSYAYPDDSPILGRKHAARCKLVFWSAEMDKHLWTTYMLYLQDPTVTPFKTLPGSPPPLGVCHRVAREARRTWRGLKPANTKPASARASPTSAHSAPDSPDTIRPETSELSTPTPLSQPKHATWPKSGSSTRKRLRELCKRKASIAPHYQRLLQSRSPSPFASSSRSASRSTRLSSPAYQGARLSPFSTRDVQVSLSTSTSSTMQPDGPLAQLGRAADTASGQYADAVPLSDASLPWASPAHIPSDLDHDAAAPHHHPGPPQLGSPFGYHTWGPSRSRQHARPSTPRMQSEDVNMTTPRLSSPAQIHGTFPYPSTHKRRAQNQLEDELTPKGSDLRESMLQEIFGGPVQDAHRRVRSRGFSLGDALIHDRLTALYAPLVEGEAGEPVEPLNTDTATPPTSEAESIKRLGSPFAGINTRPSRIRGRHNPSASLNSYLPSNFASIEQRLNQTDSSAETP